jgi:methylmalonyl-CoA mutase
LPREVIRSTTEEKEQQITTVRNLHLARQDRAPKLLKQLQEAAVQNRNIFAHLMEACKVCTLGQITENLFEVGGQYRRNM